MKNITLKNISIIMISSFIIFIGCNKFSYNKTKPKAIKGIIDIRNWNFEKDGIINLDGEWEFYWNRLLSSDDFNNKDIPEMTGYFNIPGIWNDYKYNGIKISNSGYASYRLIILKNNNNRNLALKITEVLTSYSIYINGKQLGKAGRVGKSFKTSIPKYLPQVIEFYSDDNKIEIILQISNFNNRLGGAWDNIEFGTKKQIYRMREDNIIINFFLLGSIIMMGLYHLGLFLMRRKDKSVLFFGFFCLIISLRLLTTGETFILHFFEDINWEILLKLEFLSVFIGVPVFVLFVYLLFSEKFSKIILYACVCLSSLFCVFTILTPARISSYSIVPYQILIILISIYLIYFLIVSSLKKIKFSFIFFSGFFIMFLSLLNDILYSNGIIQTIYTIPIAIFIFIFFESFVLSLRFSKAFIIVEKQKKELFETNIAYKKEIKERIKLTQELVESNKNNLNARLSTILGLAKLAEFRDKDTGYHLERIREFVRLLAIELRFNPKYKNYISEEYVDDLYYSSILHDIGKVGIPDEILLKPGKLTSDEFEIIKKHPIIGGVAINAIESKMNNRSYLALAKEIAYYHHEKWDGSGYPKGLKGDEIPLSARIVALADVYDALISKRTYKKAFLHVEAVKIINDDKGIYFDPDIVDAFNNVSNQFNEIQKQLK